MRAAHQVYHRRGGGGGSGGGRGLLVTTEEKKDDATTTTGGPYYVLPRFTSKSSRSVAHQTVGQHYRRTMMSKENKRLGTITSIRLFMLGQLRHGGASKTTFFWAIQCLLVVVVVLMLMLVCFLRPGQTGNALSGHWWSIMMRGSPVVPRVGNIRLKTRGGLGKIRSPGRNRMDDDSSEDEPFYNELDHHTDFDEAVSHRSILWDRDDPYLAKYAPDEDLEFYKGFPHYYAFDDDVNNSPVWEWEDGDTQGPRRPCRKQAHHRMQRLTCNHFHEVNLPQHTLQDEIRFVGSGAYRDVFTFTPEIVLKVAEINLDYNPEGYESLRMEGDVYSLLSPHPLIVNTYGNCALSIFNEAMTHGDMEKKAAPHYNRDICEAMPPLDGPDLLANMTNLTPTDKLEYALDMAEALSLLHNHKDGLIIHDDVHLAQFMVTNDGGLKLGDFNRAEFPKYDELHGEYCRYRNGRGHGDWRSPEEYFDKPLDEKIDVWSLGNNFYTLLTGLFPFPEQCTSKKVRELIKFQRTAWVDPRWTEHSYAERALVKIMGSCFAYHPEDRPSMGEIVRQLRNAVAENRRLNSQK